MVKLFALAALAAVAFAAPAPQPQELDFDAIDQVPEVADIATIEVLPTVTAIAVPVNSAAAIASVKADILEDPLPQVTDAPVARRSIEKRAACDPLKTTPNIYHLDLSSPDAFRNDANAAKISEEAATPKGYLRTFNSEKAATQMSSFAAGTYYLDSYDVAACAANCDKKAGCQGFNIYFSRQPSVSAGAKGSGKCENPAPTVLNMCVIYGAEVKSNTLKNTGQFRGAYFQTAHSGSNGYTSARHWKIPGFEGPSILDDRAINAPKDCNGKNTYMGVKIFTDVIFDPVLCSTACTETNAYNRRQAAKTGKTPNICTFFNTYILLENDDAVGQYCALYTQKWDDSYATNKVQWRGDDFYTKTYSFTYWDSLDSGNSQCSPLNKPVV